MNQLSKWSRRKRSEGAEDAYHKIIANPYFFQVYSEIYSNLLKISGGWNKINSRTCVEIGASGSIGKFLMPELKTFDVRPGIGVDLVLNSYSLPYGDSDVDAIIGKDVLHHMGDIEAHFREVERVLKPGNSAVYLEPNWNLWSRFLLYFFHVEPYIKNQSNWKFESLDPMYSNQALPWIVFVRDSDEFLRKFPKLSPQIHNSFVGFSYVLSGGVNGHTFLPQKLLLLIFNLELKLGRHLRWLHLARFISVTKHS
jgi:SAM-dependent methyltransferase